MTRIVLVMIASAALASAAHGQQLPAAKVPAAVRQSCASKFRGAGKTEWKLKSDRNYEAEFTLSGVDIAAKFDSTGKWLETERTIKQPALPRTVTAAISRDFIGYRIIETQTLERFDDKRLIYEVHLENAKETLKTQFDDAGALLSRSAKPRTPPKAPTS